MTPDPLPVALPELPTVAWAYTALYVPNPHLDDGIRVVRESRVAEVNGDPQSIAPLVRKSDAEAALRAQAEEVERLLKQALEALEHHREQTRPIHRTDAVIETLRAALAGRQQP